MFRSRLLFCAIFVALPLSEAFAVAKSSGGVTCESTGTERRDGKDQDGNKVNCLFDSCTFTECSTSGGTISNCVRKTEYSNARDCKAAAKTNLGGKIKLPKNGVLMQNKQP